MKGELVTNNTEKTKVLNSSFNNVITTTVGSSPWGQKPRSIKVQTYNLLSMGLETINRAMLIGSKLIYLEEILKTVELIGFREEGTWNSLQAPNDQKLGFSDANFVT
ncbi:hypothetical protein DUI87_03936 [Hirundo rustica rustica]|uniref:Uncharacterized protein n=1 Tax=Hirundo rustica rustica TaxID=333673 RepID=A0A3M0L1J4_HIRRU|nr:hypothetical protein DUI87_03936 [Hirundo rustica rustica]